jgi:dibenzofuran dioxygenase beta subunit
MTSQLVDLQREAELFLYREAKMLDNNRFDEWLELFTEDARYWMPITESREVGQERGPVAGEWALIEEDKRFLLKRNERLRTGLAHSEQPRSRTRRFVTNIVATENEDGTVGVESNLLVFQSRRGTSEQFFVGCRQDRVVRVEDDWKIAERMILLDHRVLPRAISIYL